MTTCPASRPGSTTAAAVGSAVSKLSRRLPVVPFDSVRCAACAETGGAPMPRLSWQLSNDPLNLTGVALERVRAAPALFRTPAG